MTSWTRFHVASWERMAVMFCTLEKLSDRASTTSERKIFSLNLASIGFTIYSWDRIFVLVKSIPSLGWVKSVTFAWLNCVKLLGLSKIGFEKKSWYWCSGSLERDSSPKRSSYALLDFIELRRVKTISFRRFAAPVIERKNRAYVLKNQISI